jgi:hypothetical protein
MKSNVLEILNKLMKKREKLREINFTHFQVDLINFVSGF